MLGGDAEGACMALVLGGALLFSLAQALQLAVQAYGFTAFPYEMFHENGRQTREGSPYKMTFVNSLAGGSFGYIPTKEAFPHGSYEVVTCKYTEGCGEQFVADMLSLLNQCKNAG